MHDGTAEVLVEKGTVLPTEGAVLLTSTEDNQRYIGLEIVQGLRPLIVGLGTNQSSHSRVASLQVLQLSLPTIIVGIRVQISSGVFGFR